jgi:hypothetical protein
MPPPPTAGALLRVAATASDAGKGFRVTGASGITRRLLELTGSTKWSASIRTERSRYWKQSALTTFLGDEILPVSVEGSDGSSRTSPRTAFTSMIPAPPFASTAVLWRHQLVELVHVLNTTL